MEALGCSGRQSKFEEDAMVVVKSCSTVIPSKPTPGGRMCLSECDQHMSLIYASALLLYNPGPALLPSLPEVLRSSLANALVLYYPLAGRLHRIHGGRLELACNAMGAMLFEAVSEAAVEDLGEFHPRSKAVELLVPKVECTKTPIEDCHLLLVQITSFSCASLALGLSVSHTLMDGCAGFRFINWWAKLARSSPTVVFLDEELRESTPIHDRALLRSYHQEKAAGSNASRHDHQEFQRPPILIGRANEGEERAKETTGLLLRLTGEQVEGIKKAANKQGADEEDEERIKGRRPYSRFEAVAGHLWRSVCRANNTNSSHWQPTRARLVAEIRSRVRPAIPLEYAGNAVLATVTPICFWGELERNPLRYAAEKIRAGIEKVTDEHVRSALDYMKGEEDVNKIRFMSDSGGEEGREVAAPYWGNPNVAINSWVGLPVYDVDFGWGKPEFAGPGALHNDGEIFIVPCKPGDDDGSLRVAMVLQREHVEAFQHFFNNQIDQSHES